MRNILIVILLLFSFNAMLLSDAQNDSDYVLVYEKNSEIGSEYVYVSSDTQTFIPEPSACFQIDRSGIHVAYISEDETSLTVKNIEDGKTILQTEWQSDWELCRFIWRNEQTLSIYSTSSQSYQLFDISDGDMIPTIIPTQPWPPDLPDRTPEDNIGVYIPSPSGRYYLYETCSGPECKALGGYKVFDTVLKTNVATLSRAFMSTPNRFTPGHPDNGPEARWSADDRYIAYPFVRDNINHDFNLELYDMQLKEVQSIESLNWTVAYEIPLSWSPKGHRLVFWVQGRAFDPQEGDTIDLRNAIIYDVDQEQLILADEPYYLDHNAYIIWKPDGTAFVFMTMDDELIQVDALTGAVQVVDTNVYWILAWR